MPLVKGTRKILCICSVVTVLFFMGGKTAAQTAKKEEIIMFTKYDNRLEFHLFNNETFFINDPKSPVQISKVKARHTPKRAAKLAQSMHRYMKLGDQSRIRELSREGLKITIDAEGPKAVAVKFGVIAYDAFKEYLGGLTAVTMDPPGSGMVWNFRPAYLFKFKKYGVVAVYVRQARLNNGKIWNFSPDVVLKEISKRYKKLTKEQLLKTE